MPLYEYECAACQHRFERIQKFSDPLVEVCPSCGGVVRKLLSSPAIQFKGSGWYITDYAKKGGGTDASSTSSTKTEGGEKKSDSKEPSSASSDASASTPAAPAKSDS